MKNTKSKVSQAKQGEKMTKKKTSYARFREEKETISNLSLSQKIKKVIAEKLISSLFKSITKQQLHFKLNDIEHYGKNALIVYSSMKNDENFVILKTKKIEEN